MSDRDTRFDVSLFELSPLPMWTVDRESLKFLDVNEAALRQYGFSREEFAAMTLADIRPPDEIPAMRTAIRQELAHIERKLWRHRRKDGAELTVEISATDFIADGRPVRLALVNDVTEREQARASLHRTEEQLRQAQKMEALGRLASAISHDFNNILTVVSSHAQFLEEELDVSDHRREDATAIRRASERASALTRQLLTLSRRSTMRLSALDPTEVLTEFAAMVARLVGTTIEVALRLGATPKVLADRGQLEQIVMNLAVNARDAMPGGGTLTIATSAVSVEEAMVPGLPRGSYVELAVTDTGTGMDEATRSRIFEPFFSTKGAGKGTGLGLAIVHGIVSQAGGAVSVYSAPGQGTTFRVYLPVALVPLAAAPVAAPEPPPDVLPAVSVLVLDEDPDVRAIAGRILRDAGCTALEAATLDEAEHLCVTHERVEVLLLDVGLAEHRADEIIGRLVELRPAIIVVRMSGFAASSVALSKPFSPAQLRHAIATALGARDKENETGERRSDARLRPRVLLAEDDEQLSRMLVRTLQRAEFDVVCAPTGTEALEVVRASRLDVIVSDVHMPGMTGLELIRAVRRTDLDVPVILCTGKPDVRAAAEAVEFGAFRFLTKPVDIEGLVRTIRVAARAHALARIRRQAFSVATGARGGVADRAGLEVRFEAALEKLWMAYQPIVDARSGVPMAVEALMRSDEPTMATPLVILDAATQLGRLSQLGRRVRGVAAHGMAALDAGLMLFVNLHPDDLMDVTLLDASAPLTQIASRVVLEVTERASLGGWPELPARLQRIRALGFRIAIDDIGAGYSGLTSYAELAPEIVKIDMSLVRDVHQSTLKQRTIAALCKLCHDGGTQVVGEGVETVAERDCLVELGCDLLQGYLIGRPSRPAATARPA
ncbi:MAG: EAL domain-containing protein [Deltaproteobacteria bacterium]|nr:EAL domain-containing protein [Deltaproteobacteria bacterium]